MNTALAVLAAYLLGSIPFAVVSAKLFGLADPRTYGSGNPGATNVLRSGSKAAALFTLVGDAAKGAVAVALARALGPAYGLGEGTLALVAVAAFFGHLFPVFLGFKGGKGVATAAGVLLTLDPLLGLSALGVFAVVVGLSRYVSLASISAAAAAPLLAGMMWGVNQLALAVGVMSLALVSKHWENIQRLLAGTESKLGAKKKA